MILNVSTASFEYGLSTVQGARRHGAPDGVRQRLSYRNESVDAGESRRAEAASVRARRRHPAHELADGHLGVALEELHVCT